MSRKLRFTEEEGVLPLKLTLEGPRQEASFLSCAAPGPPTLKAKIAQLLSSSGGLFLSNSIPRVVLFSHNLYYRRAFISWLSNPLTQAPGQKEQSSFLLRIICLYQYCEIEKIWAHSPRPWLVSFVPSQTNATHEINGRFVATLLLKGLWWLCTGFPMSSQAKELPQPPCWWS